MEISSIPCIFSDRNVESFYSSADSILNPFVLILEVMQDVLISGKASFKVEVPYKLIETGTKGKKPLVVYLHGFNQNIDIFADKISRLLEIPAYHLFIQGPYPLYDRKQKTEVRNWGCAWYLYDGEQEQFIKSLEISSEFIQEVTDKIIDHIDVSRLGILGYSMGGYLAGYFALSRWKHVNDLIVIGGRIKTEVFTDRQSNYGHLNVLALHGSKDNKVAKENQEKSCQELSKWGAKVTYKEVNAAHELSKQYIAEIISWLKSVGYRTD